MTNVNSRRGASMSLACGMAVDQSISCKTGHHDQMGEHDTHCTDLCHCPCFGIPDVVRLYRDDVMVVWRRMIEIVIEYDTQLHYRPARSPVTADMPMK